MYSMQKSKFIKAPSNIVWEVVADIVQNGERAPNLLYQKPEYSEEGELTGVVCANVQGVEWREDVLVWEPPREYSTAVDTSNYPYPFRKMIATNTVEGEQEGTRLTVRFDFVPDYPQPIQWIMAQITRIFMRSIITSALNNWDQAVLAHQDSNPGGLKPT